MGVIRAIYGNRDTNAVGVASDTRRDVHKFSEKLVSRATADVGAIGIRLA